MADRVKVDLRVIALVFVGLTSVCWSQDINAGKPEDIDGGKSEFQSSCAPCHGVDAKGKGPFSAQLKVPPADLTVLARKNNGVLPLNAIYEIIDGRKVIEAHGTREMPIWGRQYTQETLSVYLSPDALHNDFAFNPDDVVRTRILSLIDYLNRIQEK